MRGAAMAPRIAVLHAEREADDVGVGKEGERGPPEKRPPRGHAAAAVHTCGSKAARDVSYAGQTLLLDDREL